MNNKVYNNENFTFVYPENWEVTGDLDENNQNLILEEIDNDDTLIKINFLPNEYENLEEVRDLKENLLIKEGKALISSKKIKIEDKDISEINSTATLNEKQLNIKTQIFSENRNVYIIELLTVKEDTNQYNEVLKMIISTFYPLKELAIVSDNIEKSTEIYEDKPIDPIIEEPKVTAYITKNTTKQRDEDEELCKGCCIVFIIIFIIMMLMSL